MSEKFCLHGNDNRLTLVFEPMTFLHIRIFSHKAYQPKGSINLLYFILTVSLILTLISFRNDFFNDRTGLRRSAFPIKLAGITMGSQENLNADADTDDNVVNVGDGDGSNGSNGSNGSGTELQQFWRRRSRRNSLSNNNDSRRNSFSAGNSNSANSSSSSLDRRSLYITPTAEKGAGGSTPFGSSGQT